MGAGERIFVGLFGLCLLSLGIYVLFLADVSATWRYIGGLSIAAIGANAVLGAVTGRRPWISRVGPLP